MSENAEGSNPRSKGEQLAPYRWQKGQTGNPGGTPNAKREQLRILREWWAENGARRLIELADSKDHRVATVNLQAIWERCAGKAPEKVEDVSDKIDWEKMTDNQRMLVRAALEIMANAAGQSPDPPPTIDAAASTGEAPTIEGQADSDAV